MPSKDKLFPVNSGEYCRLEALHGDTGLRVTFHWSGDRFAHTVWACHRQQAVPLLQSVEGSGDEVWPASPPIQQVNGHHRDGQLTAILGMGMAGTSHWSLSVEASQHPRGLAFDVACRPGGGPLGRMASIYQTCVSAADPTGDNSAVLGHAARPCRIQAVSADGSWKASLQRVEQGLAVLAHASQRERLKTFRWKYRVCMDAEA